MPDLATPRRGFLAAGLALGGAALAPRIATAADAAPAALTAAPTSQAGASPRLTFHAVDIFSGATGPGLKLELSRFEDGAFKLIKTVDAVAGGRTAEPLLLGEAYVPGRYEVLMNLGEYFERLGAKLPQPAFLSKVPLRIVIHDASQRLHLPVLFSPWGYSFYRGS
ncbi:MAG: hydroxyisourate hydrolase [Burkholderiaceae bacterium]